MGDSLRHFRITVEGARLKAAGERCKGMGRSVAAMELPGLSPDSGHPTSGHDIRPGWAT